MKIQRPELFFNGIQIKSEECFHAFAKAVQTIEEQCGIHETTITINNVFFCPWIDIEKCKRTSMENLLIGLIKNTEKETNKNVHNS